jgi:hypothetical protein
LHKSKFFHTIDPVNNLNLSRPPKKKDRYGKLHNLKFQITEIVINQRIAYAPTSRFVRKFFPKNEFIIEPKGDSCQFIAKGTYLIGEIGKSGFNGGYSKCECRAKTGARADTSYRKGMAVFVHTKGDHMYEAAIGGEKFSF